MNVKPTDIYIYEKDITFCYSADRNVNVMCVCVSMRVCMIIIINFWYGDQEHLSDVAKESVHIAVDRFYIK